MKTKTKLRPLAAALLLAIPYLSSTQAQDARPAAQYWVDAATNSMSIPGMDDADDNSMAAGMMGSMMGNRGGMGGAPGRSVDLSL